LDHALVKAIACELLAETQQPLRRQSLADGTARAQHALGTSIRRSTGWRIVAQDALKPWRYQDWSLPRDPRFAEKAGPILDLYGGQWQGQSLGPKDDVLSADEKTSMQARIRCHPSLPPGPGRPASIEHAYERGGAWQYLAAWDGHRGDVMGRCAPTTGIDPFGRRVNQVLAEEPYVPAHGCSGLSTMARRIAEQPRYSACSKLIPVAFWPIHRSTPVGSIKSKSTALSSNGRYSLPMIVPIWKRSDSGWPSTKSFPINAQSLFRGNLTVPN